MRKIWNSLASLIAPFWAIAQALRDIARKLTIIQGGAGYPQPFRLAHHRAPRDENKEISQKLEGLRFNARREKLPRDSWRVT